MQQFVDKHTGKIMETIACFDRILFKGYLSICGADARERFVNSQGHLLKRFKEFVTSQSERAKQHARAVAEKSGRPYIQRNGQVRKEEKASEIAQSEGIIQGRLHPGCGGRLSELQIGPRR